MRKWLFVGIFFCASLRAELSTQDHIEALWAIGNYPAAVERAEQLLDRCPTHVTSHQYLLKSLAIAGRDHDMMGVWNTFHEQFPDQAYELSTLEPMCWGILGRGENNPNLNTRLISLVGAALVRDINAVHFLKWGLQDSNASIRSLTVELALKYGDHPLKEAVMSLFFEEKSVEVRSRLILLMGALKMETMLLHLYAVLENRRASAIEKKAAMQSIIMMQESVSREELSALTHHKRKDMRLLACEAVLKFDLKEQCDLLIPLLHDPHPMIRAMVMKTCITLGYHTRVLVESLRREARGPDPLVGVVASWGLLILDQKSGEMELWKWLYHDEEDVQIFAAAAIAGAGSYGVDLSRRVLEASDHPYVRANLAIGLIRQRQDCQQSCDILSLFLQTEEEKWMRVKGIFDPIVKSNLKHRADIPNFPEVVNQAVRLEVLNLLAMMEYEGAEEAIRCFLKQKTWKVSSFAAESLLKEGDESAIELVKELLEDPDPLVRVDAALILVVWGKDASGLSKLIEAYDEADFELRMTILGALGALADRRVVPFLVERLKEPSLNIRMVAASSLLQVLYH